MEANADREKCIFIIPLMPGLCYACQNETQFAIMNVSGKIFYICPSSNGDSTCHFCGSLDAVNADIPCKYNFFICRRCPK